MKDLKKVLALVLVIATLFGLATVSSAAASVNDYTDGGNVPADRLESVEVMSTIGIFEGDSDGQFKGDKVLTRAEAATIITRLMLGKEDAEALPATSAPYVDVPVNHWAAKYVAYCKTAKIIAGTGNGHFDPDGQLTGDAFAKMMLVALGYDPQVEGLVGSSWSTNTARLAIPQNDANLCDGLGDDFKLAAPINRLDACKMAFNTLKANMVEYENPTTSITTSDGTTVTNNGSTKASLKETAARSEGSSIDDERLDINWTAGVSKYVVQFGEKYFPKLSKTTDNVDDMGHPAAEWRYKSETIGKYRDDGDLKATYTAVVNRKDLKALVSGSVVDGIKDGDYDFTVWVDGENITDKVSHTGDTWKNFVDLYFKSDDTSAAGTGVGDYTRANDGAYTGRSGNGVVTEIYVNDDSDVTIVMSSIFLVQAASDYNSRTEELTVEYIDSNEGLRPSGMDTRIKQEDFDVSGVKEDDYLQVHYSISGDCYTMVEPATIQSGTVTKFTVKDSVTLGDQKLEYNRVMTDEAKNEDFSVNADATVVLDKYGYILYVDESASSSSYVYISEFGKNSSLSTKALATAFFTDGSDSEIEIDSVRYVAAQNDTSTTKESNKNNIADFGTDIDYTGWYTYSKGSDGKYTLTAPNTKSYSTGSVAYSIDKNATSNTTTEIVKGGTVKFIQKDTADTPIDDHKWISKSGIDPTDVKANANTIFVVRDEDGDVSLYTGVSNAPTVTLPKRTEANKTQAIRVSWVIDDEKYAKFVFVDADGIDEIDIDASSSIEDFLFVMKRDEKTYIDGNDYYECDVLFEDGEDVKQIKDSELDAEMYGATDGEGLYYGIVTDSDGYISDMNEFTKKVKGDLNTAYEFTEGDIQEASVTAKKDTLSIVDDNVNAGYAITSKTNLHLIIDADAYAVMKDPGNDWEHYTGSASAIASQLENHKVSGHVYVKREDDGKDIIEDLYLWINAAEYTGPVDEDDNQIEGDIIKGWNADAETETKKVVKSAEVTHDKDGKSVSILFILDENEAKAGKITASLRRDGTKVDNIEVQVTDGAASVDHPLGRFAGLAGEMTLTDVKFAAD